MPIRISIGLLYIIVFFTGATGLIYQVTWQKYLSRLMGSDSIATAMILSVFLGGLSLGYYFCGRLSMRVKNHFKAYAIMEGLIGAWCLFFPNLFHAVDSFTRTWSFSSPFLFIFQGFLCSVVLIGVPTVCMGGTIPFLTRGISRNLTEATKVHARVYAINTTGAFLGTLIAGFYLIPKYGLPLTLLGTAFVNLSACLSVYIIQKWIRIEIGESENLFSEKEMSNQKTEALNPIPLRPYILYITAFLSGFYVMTLENVFIRLVNLTIGSSSYSFSLIVSVFILAIAMGSYWVGNKDHIGKNFLFMNQLFIAISLLFIFLTLDTWPYWAHLIRISIQSHILGFWIYYGIIFIVLFFLLVLPAGLMGATIPIAFHELKRDIKKVGAHSGYLFSLNTVGSLSGSLIGGIALYYLFDNGSVFLIALSLVCFSTFLVGLKLTKRYLFLGSAVVILVFLLFLRPNSFYNKQHFAVGTFTFREPFLFSFNGPKSFFKDLSYKLKFYKDGPTATVAVTENTFISAGHNKPGISIVVNGKSDSNTVLDEDTLKLSAHIPALLSKARKNVLVIGLGTGVTAGEFTLYPDIESIDVAEISPTVVKALPLFADFTRHVHNNSKVHIHTADAFRFLGRSKKKYDIIVSEPSNPWVTGVDLLFTEEYYRMVNEHLTDNGLFLQWVQFYAADKEMASMVLNTVQNSFKYCHVFLASYGDLLILSSKHEFSQQDLHDAKQRYDGISDAKESLKKIRIDDFESILIREVWTPSYLRFAFIKSGIQTMDNPRLHYIAGKKFFEGKNLPASFIYNSNTARFSHEYCLSKLYPNWNDFVLTKSRYDSLVKSIYSDEKRTFLPPVDSLKIKSTFDAFSEIKLSSQEMKNLEIDLIPFIEHYPKQAKSWKDVGLENRILRERSQLLINHVMRFRDWIVPYSLNGLKNLLQEGILKDPKDSEKNWYSLQLILITLVEENDFPKAMNLFSALKKDKNGNVILENKDNFIFENVKVKLKTYALS